MNKGTTVYFNCINCGYSNEWKKKVVSVDYLNDERYYRAQDIKKVREMCREIVDHLEVDYQWDSNKDKENYLVGVFKKHGLEYS